MHANIKAYILIFIALTSLGSIVRAQRQYRIQATETIPIIDGVLDEKAWEDAEIASDFTVMSPVFGGKSEFDSRIRLIYDNNAIYIGGELYDPFPDSVSYSLSPRDDEGNADWFGVSIDTYGNNVNAFSFMITSAGVELDALEGVNSSDFSWNAVWRSAAVRTDFGWSFEMKIPYSAIRFPNKKVQDWNINLWRNVRRRRETSTWNPIDPQVFGEITQSGRIIGIENIKSPLRLSFTPYGTGYLENSYDDETGIEKWKHRLAGGMDLKFGLNDAFTLDMALIPDFGQTMSDKQILNLGPFEVQFDENRPFFLEATDLFRIGGVFYSRRIAAKPFGYNKPYNDLDDSLGEEVKSNQALAPMINGTKVSGRTKKGLGIGVFNTVEGRAFATIVDSMGNKRKVITNPLTNYNVFVLSQNLKNNSTVSLVNTNVFREGSARDANVTLGTASMYTPNGKYRVTASGKLSSIYEDGVSTFGHSTDASVGKVAGVWQYSFSYGEKSNTYDPNDLGFLYNNNSRSYNLSGSWNQYKPGKHFYRKSASLSVYYEELYKPQLYNYLSISGNIGGLHKKQLYTRLSASVNPFGVINHFESRKFGKEVKYLPSAYASWFFTSDYSKIFALDGTFWMRQYFGTSQKALGVTLSPRVRVSDRMNIILSSNVDFFVDDYGYVSNLDENYDHITLGIRDRVVVENTLMTEFIFTKRMGVDIRLRHYWQEVAYDDFLQLLDEGEMVPTNYHPLEDNGSSSHNTSYNAFTVDINYRWVFLPGSELRIVYKNNIFNSKSSLDVNYFETFNTLFDQPQINSLSMKVLFFIDALYFRGWKKKKI